MTPVPNLNKPDTVSHLMAQPCLLSATEAAAAMRAGRLTSVELVESCLARIAQREHVVGAWAALNAGAALLQARRLDREPARSAFHGVPIGIKDVIATADFPTRYNSAIYANAVPDRDAHVVRRARQAGMIILGKTTTQEFATRGTVAPTRHPLDLARSPGGSSSGSAASVADFMAPLALSTQTAGSIIRPASYCGIVGFKPCMGSIDPRGTKAIVPSFDTLGVHTRSVADALTAFKILCSTQDTQAEQRDEHAHAHMLKVALVEGPDGALVQRESALTWAYARKMLEGASIRAETVFLGSALARITSAHDTISDFEASHWLEPERHCHPNLLSRDIHIKLRRGRRIDDAAYRSAWEAVHVGRMCVDAILERYDVILTLSAPGHAPPVRGNEAGDSIFSKAWTTLGLPCISIPIATVDGMPVGLQVVGQQQADLALLHAAQHLHTHLTSASDLPPYP